MTEYGFHCATLTVNGEERPIPDPDTLREIFQSFPDEESRALFHEWHHAAQDSLRRLFGAECAEVHNIFHSLCEEIQYDFHSLLYDFGTYNYFNWVFGNTSNIDTTYDRLIKVLTSLQDPDTASKKMQLPEFIFPPKMEEAHNFLIKELREKYNVFNLSCCRINAFLRLVAVGKHTTLPTGDEDLSKIPLSICAVLSLLELERERGSDNLLAHALETGAVMLADFSQEHKPIAHEKYAPYLNAFLPKFRNAPSVTGVKVPRQCPYCNKLYELTRNRGFKVRYHCKEKECEREHKRQQKATQRAKKLEPNKWVKASIGFCPMCRTKNVPLNATGLCKVCVKEAPKG
jgi:glutaredoxin